MPVLEPFDAGSHFIGLLVAAAGTSFLPRTGESRARLLAFRIYGATTP